MTVKEASHIFNLDEKEIRKRKQDDMIIGVRKDGKLIFIPDDTKIIPSKIEIKAFLLEIIKYKNNDKIVLYRSLCPDCESLIAVAEYLNKKGFIGKYDYFNNADDFFDEVKLTDKGIEFIFEKESQKIAKYQFFPIQLNPNNSLVSLTL